ncbi:MAG: PilZ domain-containing protein [Pseudomonadota bacterium]
MIKTTDLREVLKDAHAHFFFFKGDQAMRLRLWDIGEDYILIDVPVGAPMHKTLLGLIPTLDGSAVYEIEAQIESEPLPDQMPDTLRLRVDPSQVKKVNRRVYPRVSFTPPIDATISIEGEDKKIAARIINLSAGGLRAETLEELPPDRSLLFNFEIACDDEIHEVLRAGKIVYELPIESGYSYGIKFETDQDETLQKFEEASVDTLEKTVDLLSLVNKLLVRQ